MLSCRHQAKCSQVKILPIIPSGDHTRERNNLLIWLDDQMKWLNVVCVVHTAKRAIDMTLTGREGQLQHIVTTKPLSIKTRDLAPFITRLQLDLCLGGGESPMRRR